MRGQTRLTVRIPAGVQEGSAFPCGSGRSGPSRGAFGRLSRIYEEKEHAQFTRDGDDVILQLPVSFSQAALGSEIKVPTLRGQAVLSVPAGMNGGRVFSHGTQGDTRREWKRVSGDQLVQVLLWTPRN